MGAEVDDVDLDIDAALGRFDLTTDGDCPCEPSTVPTATTASVRAPLADAQTGTHPSTLVQMRVIKRAKLRVSSARDSATCGFLNTGVVVTVLERVNLEQERVRCAQGWLSVTSASGNTLLEPVGVAERLDSQQERNRRSRRLASKRK